MRASLKMDRYYKISIHPSQCCMILLLIIALRPIRTPTYHDSTYKSYNSSALSTTSSSKSTSTKTQHEKLYKHTNQYHHYHHDTYKEFRNHHGVLCCAVLILHLISRANGQANHDLPQPLLRPLAHDLLLHLPQPLLMPLRLPWPWPQHYQCDRPLLSSSWRSRHHQSCPRKY